MTSKYDFVTLWRVSAPIDRVWPVIADAEHWPDWWRAVASVQLLDRGDPSGIGARSRITFRTALPYGFTFDTIITRLEPPHVMEAQASGDLVGRGLWTLTADGESCLVRYDWNISTNKAWMNRLAPLMRPAFNWNHDVVMRWGAEGLSRRLGVVAQDVSHSAAHV